MYTSSTPPKGGIVMATPWSSEEWRWCRWGKGQLKM